MLVERIGSQSEVIRASVSGYSPCLWGQVLAGAAAEHGLPWLASGAVQMAKAASKGRTLAVGGLPAGLAALHKATPPALEARHGAAATGAACGFLSLLSSTACLPEAELLEACGCWAQQAAAAAGSLESAVRGPRHMDCPPTRWPESPRIVMQCAPCAPNGPNRLGFCVFQGAHEPPEPVAVRKAVLELLPHCRVELGGGGGARSNRPQRGNASCPP